MLLTISHIQSFYLWGGLMKKVIVLLCGMMLLFNLVGICQATLIVSWEFTNTPATADPMDTVEIWATIFNNSTADENMIDYGQIGSGWDQPGQPYTANADSISLSQLDHLDLLPGESFSFFWGLATPIAPPVSPGTYEVVTWGLLTFLKDTSAGTPQGEPLWFLSDNSFNVNVVPIPGALWLLGSGLLGLLGLRRKKG